MATNVQAIQGEWKHLCALARQRWSQLTEDDLPALEGNFEQLVDRIQQKTGEGREAIERFFSEMSIARLSGGGRTRRRLPASTSTAWATRSASATTGPRVWSAATRRRR